MQARLQFTRRFVFTLGVATLAFAACTRDRPPAGTEQPKPSEGSAAPAPAVAAPPSAPAAPAAGDQQVSGTVVETMDAAGYTYAKLDRGTGQVWVAGPETKLTVGTVVGAVDGTLMPGFHSDTLNRTFEQIYFINSFPIAGSAPPNPHAGSAAAANPHAGSAAAPTGKAPLIEKVEPAAGGQTIAQVFAGKATLVGKPVVIRGKVVKVNNGILGRNWFHIQDGTGAAGTNDLTITSAATAALGDIVVVRGTLAANKDFGAGYKYELLVEDATFATK